VAKCVGGLTEIGIFRIENLSFWGNLKLMALIGRLIGRSKSEPEEGRVLTIFSARLLRKAVLERLGHGKMIHRMAESR
jgi:hypothetical protein